jgi:hypothetical protein
MPSDSSAASSNVDDSPEASTTMGARVCSPIAAISTEGSVVERVACTTTWRCPPANAAVASPTFSLHPTKSSSG